MRDHFRYYYSHPGMNQRMTERMKGRAWLRACKEMQGWRRHQIEFSCSVCFEFLICARLPPSLVWWDDWAWHMTPMSLRRGHFACIISSLLLAGWNAVTAGLRQLGSRRGDQVLRVEQEYWKKCGSLVTSWTILAVELPTPDFLHEQEINCSLLFKFLSLAIKLKPKWFRNRSQRGGDWRRGRP